MTKSAPAIAPAADTNTPAADLLKPTDPATGPKTFEQWETRRAALVADPRFRERYMRGDGEAVAAMKQVFAALNPKTDPASAEEREFSQRLAALTPLRVKANLDNSCWNWVAAGGPVAAHERQRALELKEQFFRDKQWVARHLDGGRLKTQMVNVNLVLSSKVASAEEIEKFKKANDRFLTGHK